MKRRGLEKTVSALVALVLALVFALPATALAADRQVRVDNHLASGEQRALTNIRIDGVDAPRAGMPLDDKAQVNSAEGETWEIPVLWVGDDLGVATEAAEGRTYLPALVFFVPQGCTIEGGSFTVTLSDSVARLFGNEDAISVYDPSRGVTYILPASLRDFFTAARAQGQAAGADELGAVNSTEQAPEQTGAQVVEVDSGAPAGRTQVEIHCAKAARDAFTDEDLEWLVDLVKNRLEPQAVNLLISKFPAFSAAAANQELGSKISLYVYFKNGDKDGIPEHENATEAMAFVSGDVAMRDGELTCCYLIGIDADSLVAIDEDENPIRDAATGKLTLERSGKSLETLNNTIVHESLHALMDDYNRTGILGAKNVRDGYTPGNKFVNDAQERLYHALRYPSWFIEGTASAMENVYQFRHYEFQRLREKIYGSFGDREDTFTRSELLYNYQKTEPSFDLEWSSRDDDDAIRSSYVSGYLAVLYLSQLAAQKSPAIGSAQNADGSFSGDRLRLGLSSILERMHNGETLDAVIRDISTSEGGNPLYASTEDFQKRFIKGVAKDDESYEGDDASVAFTLDYLNYLLSIEKTPGRTYKPNGSILFDLAGDYNAPLDPSKEATSDFYRIVDSNVFEPSTVPADVAFASGGKSEPVAVAAASEVEVPVVTETSSDEAADALAAKAPGSDACEPPVVPAGVASAGGGEPEPVAVAATPEVEVPPAAEAPSGEATDAQAVETSDSGTGE